MSKERTLIRGGTVITMEPGVPDRVADILIDGDQIAAVGTDLNVADGSARIVDAADHIVVPGFIDTHRHVYQILLRGLGSNWSLTQYLVAIIATRTSPPRTSTWPTGWARWTPSIPASRPCSTGRRTN